MAKSWEVFGLNTSYLPTKWLSWTQCYFSFSV